MKFFFIVFFISSLFIISLESEAKISPSFNLPIYKINKNKPSAQLRVKSSSHAASLAKRRFGGKILRVSRRQVNGYIGYRVKLIKNNGDVITVSVNAKTGRVSN